MFKSGVEGISAKDRQMDLQIFPRKERHWKKKIGIFFVSVFIMLFPVHHQGETQGFKKLSFSPEHVDTDPFLALEHAGNLAHSFQLASLEKSQVSHASRTLKKSPRKHAKSSRHRRYLSSNRVTPFHLLGMEKEILRELDEFEQARLLIPGDELSVRVIDLKANRLIASVEANKKRMAASLIKPFVMLAVYEDMSSGRLKKTRRLEKLLRRMIVVSNNWATNKLVSILGHGNMKKGLRRVNQIISEYKFTHTRMVEKIPPGGKTYRNYTNARDLSRFFYLLYHQKLVSPYYCKLMEKKFLAVRTSRVRTRFLRKDKVPVADKTGFVCGLNGDAGIIFLSNSFPTGHDYIFVFLAENLKKPRGRRWCRQKTRVIRRLSNRIYLAFKAQTALMSHSQVVTSSD